MPSLIRLANRDDAAAVAAIYRPFCESRVTSFEYVAPDAEEMARRITSITAQFPWLVLVGDDDVIGYAYACRHRERAAYAWAVDTAVYIDSAHHRRGLGRALYTALFQILRGQGYYKAYAGITLPNAASVGLHEAMGFTPVGVYRGVGYKHGAWHDVGWYQLAIQPERPNPDPPIAIASLIGSTAWTDAIASRLAPYRAEHAGE